MEENSLSRNIKWIIASVLVPVIIAVVGYWFTMKSNEHSPGKLEILDIQVVQPETHTILKSPEKNKSLIDFRVNNTGGEPVLINKVEFKLLDIVSLGIKGFLDFSKIYDLDISLLKSTGDVASVSVAQEIGAGEIDRFGIAIVSKNLPVGIERGWRLQPTLFTSSREIVGKTIEIWFPFESQADDPEYFVNAKRWEKEEQESIRAAIKETKTIQNNIGDR